MSQVRRSVILPGSAAFAFIFAAGLASPGRADDDNASHVCRYSQAMGADAEEEARCFAEIGNLMVRAGPLVTFRLDGGFESVVTLDGDRLSRLDYKHRLAIFAPPPTDCVSHVAVDLRSGQTLGIYGLPIFSPDGKTAVSQGFFGPCHIAHNFMIIERASGRLQSVFLFPPEPWEFDGTWLGNPQWVDDNTVLFTIQDMTTDAVLGRAKLLRGLDGRWIMSRVPKP